MEVVGITIFSSLKICCLCLLSKIGATSVPLSFSTSFAYTLEKKLCYKDMYEALFKKPGNAYIKE
jgi:hypothetical protein